MWASAEGVLEGDGKKKQRLTGVLVFNPGACNHDDLLSDEPR